MNVDQKNIINEGARLKQVLKDKAIKVIDFAKRAGFSNQIAHYYLRQESIKRTTLVGFCEVLGISLEQFYSWNQVIKIDAEDLHQGKRLATLIDQKGINKTKLAERIRLSRRALYNLLELETLSAEQLRKVLSGLDMTVNEFLNPGGFYDAGVEYNEAFNWREKYYGSLEDYKKLTQAHQMSQHRAELELAQLRAENERLKLQMEEFKRELAKLRSQPPKD
ncbi:helix-turn-helix domain-containing protein [uncultured Chitinophaga sp.]|uniref:helix-turn-helix domain-containing protein n=1 Tax=uncultured Chitinophaga sp. TaxID=339340 RepID=UPI0025F9A987|nr:helix-turn-helix domain-containing protein [uncultured Chitinophaga sp.]